MNKVEEKSSMYGTPGNPSTDLSTRVFEYLISTISLQQSRIHAIAAKYEKEAEGESTVL